jgi:hypothetical protein
MRHGGSRRILPSCRSCCAKRESMQHRLCVGKRRPGTKNRRSISGSAKRDTRGCRSNTPTLWAQPTQYRIERNAARHPPHQYAPLTTTQSVAAASIKISGSA